MKKITTLVLIFICLCLSVDSFGQKVKDISLDPENWASRYERGDDAQLSKNGNSLVLEVPYSAELSYQGVCCDVVANLDDYPNLKVTLSESSTATWALKILYGEGDNPISNKQEATIFSDSQDYGTWEENLTDVTEETGELSFELWLWAVDKGTKLIVDELKLYGVGSSINSDQEQPCFVYTQKGQLIIDGAINRLISVYTLEGKLVKSLEGTENNVTIDLDKGFYIINVGGGHSFKKIVE